MIKIGTLRQDLAKTMATKNQNIKQASLESNITVATLKRVVEGNADGLNTTTFQRAVRYMKADANKYIYKHRR